MSSKKAFLAAVVAACIALATVGAQGQVASQVTSEKRKVTESSQLINYQGFLTDAGGSPITNPSLSMNFRIFDAETDGTLLWEETQSVAVTKGVLNVLLGSSTAMPLNLFDASSSRWLEVSVAGTTLTPRRRFGNVPYDAANKIAITATDFWNLTGNAGTTAGINFLGTTDNVALELKVKNARALRIEPASNPDYAPNGNNLIGGFNGNTVTSGVIGATISGGGSPGTISFPTPVPNSVTGNFGTVGGGTGNQAGGTDGLPCGTVGGGEKNTASGSHTTVAGGIFNLATGPQSTVGGGYNNIAGISPFNGGWATVSGGLRNQAQASYVTVGGGAYNRATADYATIAGGGIAGGGPGNRATDKHCTVGGGGNNQAGNGNTNLTDASFATVAGGSTNEASGSFSTVGGGAGNIVSGLGSTIAGGQSNTAPGAKATVSGGIGNVASGDYATVGGGFVNAASTLRATIGGGYSNKIYDDYGTIGGGESNSAGNNSGTNSDASHATVGGGRDNGATAFYSAIAGGRSNLAAGWYSSVSGGNTNQALGYAAAIPGGWDNTALGARSFAAGRRAKANHDGAFVWADDKNFDFASTVTNQFNVRATGGTRIVSAINSTTGAPTAGVKLVAGSNAWASLSDRNAKANFAPVDGREVLARLAGISIQTWNYKSQDPSIRHIGPMAQDFYAAFGVGEENTHITTLDADGVALAAIQGVYQIVQEKDAQITALKAEIAALQKQTMAFEARVAALESAIQKSTGSAHHEKP